MRNENFKMIIVVVVNPHSRFEKIEKIDDKNYQVSFNVTPEKGRANKRLIEMLAKYFDVSKSMIEIKLGKTAREKVVEILGI
jgi:uncharacterized protein